MHASQRGKGKPPLPLISVSPPPSMDMEATQGSSNMSASHSSNLSEALEDGSETGDEVTESLSAPAPPPKAAHPGVPSPGSAATSGLAQVELDNDDDDDDDITESVMTDTLGQTNTLGETLGDTQGYFIAFAS